MAHTLRGGAVWAWRGAFDASGRKVNIPFFLSYLIVRNKGAAVAKIYFTEKDFLAGNDQYAELPIASATYPYGEWQGPVETDPGERDSIWIKGATTVEIAAFQKRA
jgi:hypothetical protein